MSEQPGPANDVFLPFAPTPDRDSSPYWGALRRGELRLQRCRDCRALRWPARALCNRCRSFEFDWETFDDPPAHVLSWIRTHQVFAPALRDAVPYWVVQVSLDAQDDLLLIGGWVADRAPIAGEPVALVLVEGAGGQPLPCWRPRSKEGDEG